MTQKTKVKAAIRHQSQSDRAGIILLVVLGMLALFSVLGVSYLVFTTRQRTAAYNIQRAEAADLDGAQLVDNAMQKLLVGANGPESSLWGHDLLGDLYGMRDAIEASVAPVQTYTGPTSEVAPAQLLNGQFLRFPSLLYLESPFQAGGPPAFPHTVAGINDYLSDYPNRRNDNEVTRRYPGYGGSVSSLPLNPNSYVTPNFPHDDELNGRLLTFLGGPLEGLTFPVARYFGDHRNAPYGRAQLSGQVVLDIREHHNSPVTIGDITQSLGEWLSDSSFRIDRLFYDYNPNATALPGTALPYARFYLNGRILNGPGLGWDRPRNQYNQLMGVDRLRAVSANNPVRPFNLNEVISTDLNITQVEKGVASGLAAAPVTGVPYQVPAGPFDPSAVTSWPLMGSQALPLRNGTDVPVALQGHYAIHRLAKEEVPGTTVESFLQDLPPGDTDEPYDAPDYNNLWLSYMPTDPILGEASPSFVRPAILNWIINNHSGTLDTLRLQRMIVAMQRSTLRPLPIANDPMVPSVVADRGVGVKNLDYSNFTGSNDAAGLNQPIDFTNPTSAQVISLARALAGRDDDGDGVIDSWDVDNNGDGIVDGVWVDAGLPLTQNREGELIKPMVSYLVEDLGGRVNVNLAGNMSQARNAISKDLAGAVQHASPIAQPTSNAAVSPARVYTQVPPPPNRGYALETGLPNGWGYGPAEIDVRALFASIGTRPVTVTERAPLASYGATDLMRGPQRLVADRLGVFSNAVGRARAYADMGDTGYGRIVAVPGYLVDPVTNSNNDLVGVLRTPNRPNLHGFLHPQGLPVDAYGRGAIGLGVNGELVVGGTSHIVSNGGPAAGDSLDDPYEMDLTATTEPDKPYSVADMEPLLRFDSFDRDMLSDRLIEIIEEYHNNPDIDGNGTTTNAEYLSLQGLRKALADSMTTHSVSAAAVRGGMPPEFFERTVDATAASSPQQLLQLAVFPPAPDNTPARIDQARNAVMWELMPEELRAGRKLNLNRPFGNGFDNDNDGVIDDDQNGRIVNAGISSAEFNESYYMNVNGVGTTPLTSTRGNSTPGELFNPQITNHASLSPRNVTPRALFARHLYVLAMTLIRDANRGVDFDFPHSYPDLASFDSPFIAGPRPDDTSTPGIDENLLDRQDEFNQEYRAMKIAQWAANIADFRDSDAVMTRFDYDPNPFDGWDVNVLDPTTYRTVWGLERPELTLEESLAFHDRRVRDTNLDDGGADLSLEGTDGTATRGDADLDQWRIPQGSLFLELRSTRSPQVPLQPGSEIDPVANAAAYPPELYSHLGTQQPWDPWALDLNRKAPGNDVPVWRVAISEFHSPDSDVQNSTSATRGRVVSGTNPATTPFYEGGADLLLQPVGSGSVTAAAAAGVTMDRDTATLNPAQPRFFDPTSTTQSATAIDRVIFFANNVDPSAMATTLADVSDAGQVFYNRYADGDYDDGGVYLAGGQHAVIGPRAQTFVGSKKNHAGTPTHDATTSEPTVNYQDYESPQQIELSPHQIVHHEMDGTLTTPIYDDPNAPQQDASIRPVIGIQAAADPPTSWTTITTPIGVNVSEPLPYETPPAGREYYLEPTRSLNPTRNFPVDSYRDFDSGAGQFPDRPFDDRPDMSELYRAFGSTGQRTGTRAHFKTAYLQRLADPTQPYHADMNPFITVDYITIDLTVFNGSDENEVAFDDDPNPAIANQIWKDPVDEDPFTNDPQENFASRYKTGKTVVEDATTASFDNLLHSVNTFPPEATTVTPQDMTVPDAVFFAANLNRDTATLYNDDPSDRTIHSTTLGYLNHSYGPRWRQGPVAAGAVYNSAQSTFSPFVGQPYSGFPASVLWLNRPFVSAEELMWVPVSSPGRLGMEFGSAVGAVTSDQHRSLYNAEPVSGTSPSAPPVPTAVPAPLTPTQPSRFDFNQRFTHLWNFFSSSANVFAYEPATYEVPSGTLKPDYPWLPSDPSSGNDFVGMPTNMPAMSDPYPEIPEKWPSPNFWRLLEWVEVPPPYDFDADFVTPEADHQIAGENSLFSPRIDFRTLGDIATVNADPRSWNNVVISPSNGWHRATGSWRDNVPTNNSYNNFWTNDIITEAFRPPFSFRSKLYRNGLVNLNTIKSVNVYKALMGGFSTPAELDQTLNNRLPAGMGAFWDEFLRNRRGYTPDSAGAAQTNNWFESGTDPLQTFDHDDNPGTPEIPSFDRNIPTQFAGVFRSAMSSNIAPLESMRTRTVDPTDHAGRIHGPGPGYDPIEREELLPTDSGLLRRDFVRDGGTPIKPVFQREPTDPAVTAPQNHEKSVVHQQLGITRLSNLATDQSNVFAVWVTVGYFEVDGATMQVGQEVGVATGEVTRPKGFFVIDRSKPVMYRPGELNNALETIQLSRILE
ncbi:hypothetical protein LOC71_19260 [Rhodopirellula sp. JC740]|uniref:Uncharacterized protein n=1 Tax=Rhodopirellula halodulae TaxID=2894198 RepID=A0ABS8NLK0_9BACT|nr:hypothetical protein [Rhodopirellula sp. JC740]